MLTPGFLDCPESHCDPGEEQYEDEEERGAEREGEGEGTCYICRGRGGVENKGEEGCVEEAESVKAAAPERVTIPP